MPQPNIDFAKRLKLVPTHVIDLLPEADRPSDHFEQSANDAWAMVVYFGRNLTRVNVYPAASERQMRRLHTMVLLNFVEAFERFLKELAAACIDLIAAYILDDRLNVFNVQGGTLAAHFKEGTVGRSLCESSTWLNHEDVNKRFKKILAAPFADGQFTLFAKNSERHNLVGILWQLRHSIVHNAALITRSDALKLRLLTKQEIVAPMMLWPTRGDVWYVKLYLQKIVMEINAEVKARLDDLMTTLVTESPGLIDPADEAQKIANVLGLSSSVAGQTRAPI